MARNNHGDFTAFSRRNALFHSSSVKVSIHFHIWLQSKTVFSVFRWLRNISQSSRCPLSHWTGQFSASLRIACGDMLFLAFVFWTGLHKVSYFLFCIHLLLFLIIRVHYQETSIQAFTKGVYEYRWNHWNLLTLNRNWHFSSVIYGEQLWIYCLGNLLRPKHNLNALHVDII
jgi:hypothetical protein